MVDESDMDDDQDVPLQSAISASLKEDHNQDERWEHE